MKLDDYTIPIASLDTTELLNHWSWLVPLDAKPVLLTKFGDWFFRGPFGDLYFLDLLEVTYTHIGRLEDALPFDECFCEKFKEELSVAWTDICMERGLHLEDQQCYGWERHPQMDGEIAFTNIKVFSLRVYQSVVGQIFRQISSRDWDATSGFKLEELPGEDLR